MSEKKIILICLASFFILSTILIYLMLWKDINIKAARTNTNNAQVNTSNSEINNKPKIEIEISK